MSSSFTHLHVASGYSLRYGASTPQALVEAAVAQGMSALALTDRDGAYGAVKFVLACKRAGITPVLGADLAVERSAHLTGLPGWADPRPAETRRTPVRGGAGTDPFHPRATVLALGGDPAAGLAPGQGWAHLCRLISATHLRGERGRPVATLDLIAAHAVVPGRAEVTDQPVDDHRISRGEGPACLVVLLGPGSDVGRALLAGRSDLAGRLLHTWRQALPQGSLAVEVVCHEGPPRTPGSLTHAAALLRLAREHAVPAVLSHAVRHATPTQAMTVDVLDAVRRLVPLAERHLDGVNAAAHLTGPDHMAALAHRIAGAACGGATGQAQAEAARLLADTQALAARCHLDPAADIGLGSVHLPEPEVLGVTDGQTSEQHLRWRCEAGISRRYPHADAALLRTVHARMDAELHTIAALGYDGYFLTVGIVCDLIRDRGVRVAARGSGAGSMVNHLLGISGIDPLRHDLVMERFLSPLRAQLPDIDVDVESARRTEMYEAILERFGAHRVACVSMMDTYRVRHAVRDVGAALGMPPTEIDTIATSFPHIRARDVRHAIAELPELHGAGLSSPRLGLLFDLVEQLDGLPRHVALHPCGVLLSDSGLLGRTPVEASWMGFPMSQFDKDDVEELGLLKLDVLGVRMQSAMAYALDEIARVDGPDAATAGGHPEDAAYLEAGTGRIDLDAVPHDDEATFRLIRTSHTLGCFQIESPGQRELIGKFAPETFADLVVDISLFRPGPVKSDMVTPFLKARQGWEPAQFVHPGLAEVLAPTCGVVVFHEQVLQLVSITAGCDLAEADEVRRAMGSVAGQAEVEAWWRPRAAAQGFDAETVEEIWRILTAFASFGFCKAHAAAFALPTYQSAWLKAHHPAAFLAGVLTHDPGMYPKRLILDDARNLGITVLPLDVNASGATYRVEKVEPAESTESAESLESPEGAEAAPADAGADPVAGADLAERAPRDPDLPDGRGYGIRLALTDVKGIAEAEVSRIVAGQPYADLPDLWHRASPSRPVAERLVLTGALDSLYGLDAGVPLRRRRSTTRRDLVLQVADLDRWSRAGRRSSRALAPRPARPTAASRPLAAVAGGGALTSLSGPITDLAPQLVRAAAAAQSQAPAPAPPALAQLALELGDDPGPARPSGLPEMTGAERVRAELDILGLDVSSHVLDFYRPVLDALGITWAKDLLTRRSRAELLVAGVKVATQTPPVRSGRRVVFLTLDDSTGPLDATFFEDVQGPYAATVFHSWLLVVRGVLRRTGPRGVSLRATGAWELPLLWDAWSQAGVRGMQAVMATAGGWDAAGEQAVAGAAQSRSSRPVMARPPVSTFHLGPQPPQPAPGPALEPVLEPDHEPADGSGAPPGHRRVLVHASGFRQSPYADVKPPGGDTRDTRRMASNAALPSATALPPLADAALDQGYAEESWDQPEAHPGLRPDRGPDRKLWHASAGSSGR
ncbi:MAG: PHP domain-containing protein [Kineosporiaceae bacterium]